jgi:hypothetical protein
VLDLLGFGQISAEEVSVRGGEPAGQDEIDEITAALNTISAEIVPGTERTTQRMQAKMKFLEKFGEPDALTKAQITPARRFVEAAGGTFATRETEPPAAGPASPSSETQPASPGLEDAGNESGAGSSTPVADKPETSREAVEGATNGEPRSPSPTDSSGSEPPPPAVEEGEVAAHPVPASPTARTAAPVESTKEQRTRIGAQCSALNIDKADKAIIVQVLTNFRATSTTEMTKDEASKMIAALVKIQQGHIGIGTFEVDGEQKRGLGPKTPIGEAWINAIATDEVPDA